MYKLLTSVENLCNFLYLLKCVFLAVKIDFRAYFLQSTATQIVYEIEKNRAFERSVFYFNAI